VSFEIHNYTGDIMATMKTAIATMKVAQISRPGGKFEIVEREIPKPADGQVRIKIQACGICHSDAVTKDGMFPWIQYPRIPGHEVVGTAATTVYVFIAGAEIFEIARM
jgi:Zn-dependent alcohol dehydrogenase